MGFADVAVMILIITGAFYLLYRSVWKKQGHCSGCDAGTCNAKGGGKRADCH
ncbi:MAG: FeoB-associated Cys-rich membrane protein [Nitrospirota bacterium]